MKPIEKGIRPEKESMETELAERVSDVNYLFVADYTGMDMPNYHNTQGVFA